MNIIALLQALLPLILQVINKPKDQQAIYLDGLRAIARDSNDPLDIMLSDAAECVCAKEGADREAFIAAAAGSQRDLAAYMAKART